MGVERRTAAALVVALALTASLAYLPAAIEDPGATLEQMLPPDELAELDREARRVRAPEEAALVVLEGRDAPWEEARLERLKRALEAVEGVRRVEAPLAVPVPENDRLTLLPVTLDEESARLERAGEVDAGTSAVLAAARAEGERAYAIGRPRLRAESWRLAREDLRLLLPVFCLAALGVPYLFFRGLRTGVFALLVAACTCALTLWGVRLATGTLSPQALFVVPVLWSVSTLDVLHLVGRRDARARGASGPAALLRARRELLAPCFVTSITTALGFSVVGATARSELVRVIALAAAPGVLAAYALTFGGATWILASDRDGRSVPRWPRALGLRVVRAARRARRGSLTAWAVAALGSLALLPAVEPSTAFPRLFAARTELARDMEHLADALGTDLCPLELTLEATSADGTRPEALFHAVLAVTNALRALPETRFVLPVDAVPGAEDELAAAVKRPISPPEREAAVARLLDRDELSGWVAPDRTAARLQVHLAPTSWDRKRAILRDLEHFDRTMLSRHRLHPGGAGYVAFRTEELGLGDLRLGAMLAGGLLLVTLVLGMRSPRRGAAAFVASVLPLLVVGAVMAVAGIPWSISLLPLPAVLLGVAVDDSVHLLWPATSGRERYAALPAILASTTMLVLCTLALLATSLRPNVAFGSLAAAGLAAALACDLTLLPALGVTSRRRR